jgi:hypothetical protein
MPFCPVCRDEFQSWVKVCPDDGVALVDELPPLPKTLKSNEPAVRITTAPNEPIATLWAGILKDNGINCRLSTGSSGVASGGLIWDLPVAIYVLASESRRAMEILGPYLGNVSKERKEEI